eukprot:TRINITY_DN1159_c3_g1_i1.p1 TRINITY_DN1159_c3_g1~~TRINITY_DN1159_c3_g1_i1.p1  ORF type:complete len:552 (-),score=132.69 TRINITY_DN1159_c3_g1_i1:146-1801(-)
MLAAAATGGSINLLASSDLVSTPCKAGKENCGFAASPTPQQHPPVMACTPTKTRAPSGGTTAGAAPGGANGAVVLEGMRTQGSDGGIFSRDVPVKNTFVHLSPEKVKTCIATPPRTAPSSLRALGGLEGLRGLLPPPLGVPPSLPAGGGGGNGGGVGKANVLATPARPSMICPSPVAPTPEVHGALRTPGPFSDMPWTAQFTGATMQQAATKVLRLSDHLTSPAIPAAGQQSGTGSSPQAGAAQAQRGQTAPAGQAGSLLPQGPVAVPPPMHVPGAYEVPAFPSVPPLPQPIAMQTCPAPFAMGVDTSYPSQYCWPMTDGTGLDTGVAAGMTGMSGYTGATMIQPQLQLSMLQHDLQTQLQSQMAMHTLPQQPQQMLPPPPLFPIPATAPPQAAVQALQPPQTQLQPPQQLQQQLQQSAPALTTDVVTVMSTAFSGSSLLAPPPLAAPLRSALMAAATAPSAPPPTAPAPVAPPPPLPPQLSPVFNGKVSISVGHFPEPGSSLPAQPSPPPPPRSPLVDLGEELSEQARGAAAEQAMRERCAGLRGELWLN